MTSTDADLMHHAVAQDLGIEIIDGNWAVGESRTLDEVQERFGVSRTVAREASRTLELLGLVRSRRRTGLLPQPRAGWSVLNPQLIQWRLKSTEREQQIISLTQLRIAVEPAAAAAAALNADAHSRAALLPIAAELRRTGEAGDLIEFLQHDIEFHRTVLRSSGNELFAALSEHVAVILHGRTELGRMPERPEPEALDWHEAVAEAVFRGHSAEARQHMQAMLDEVQEAMSDPAQARDEG